MKIRNTVTAVFMTFSVFLLAAPSAFADTQGAGEWDYVGGSGFNYEDSNGLYVTSVVKSGGGDFRACVNTRSGLRTPFRLYEYDPDNPDEAVGALHYLDDGDCINYINIGGYVDGTDGQAEFYLGSAASSAEAARFWD